MIKSLAANFGKLIRTTQLSDVVIDYSEVVLDSSLMDGLIKEIPIVKTLMVIYNVGSSVVQASNLKKALIFLKGLAEIPLIERENFLKKLEKDDPNGNLLEKILIQLERLDDELKVEMVANMFKLYVRGKIEKNTFLRCCGVIERAFVADLISLYLGFLHVSGNQNIDKGMFGTYVDNDLTFAELNDNLKGLGILRKDLVFLNERTKMENNISGIAYAESSLTPLGMVLVLHMF